MSEFKHGDNMAPDSRCISDNFNHLSPIENHKLFIYITGIGVFVITTYQEPILCQKITFIYSIERHGRVMLDIFYALFLGSRRKALSLRHPDGSFRHGIERRGI